MDQAELRQRTKKFALRIVRLVSCLPKNKVGDVLGRQLLKAGTSIGANYREATRASSRKHFISILEITLREADETVYWLELLREARIVEPERLADLVDEAAQLVAIFAATVRTSKAGRPPRQEKAANPR